MNKMVELENFEEFFDCERITKKVESDMVINCAILSVINGALFGGWMYLNYHPEYIEAAKNYVSNLF